MTTPHPSLRRVRVDVANLWLRPDSARVVDTPMTSDEPDVSQWLAQLDVHADESESGDGRLGLHGRLQTQLVADEPVLLLGADPEHPGWVQVCAPWQPTSLDGRGYPGWVRASHLTPPSPTSTCVLPTPRTPPPPTGSSTGREHPLLALARRHLDLPYLWAGVSAAGLDCSGLVHWCHRELGVVVPRDADDQQEACTVVPLDRVQPGDLYFFHHPGAARAHHVGIVTERGSMIHAPETGQGLTEGPLDERRQATLTGAGRLPS